MKISHSMLTWLLEHLSLNTRKQTTIEMKYASFLSLFSVSKAQFQWLMAVFSSWYWNFEVLASESVNGLCILRILIGRASFPNGRSPFCPIKASSKQLFLFLFGMGFLCGNGQYYPRHLLH